MNKGFLICIFLLLNTKIFSQASLATSGNIMQPQEQINLSSEILGNGFFNFNPVSISKSALIVNPNPSSSIVHIAYTINSTNKISLAIFNQIGQELIVLMKEYQKEGNYYFDSDISKLLPGIYFIRLNTGKEIITKKLLIN